MPRPMPKKSTVAHSDLVPMRARPELAVFVARVAIGWSDVERRLGSLLVKLLGADARTGMKMYRALSGAASQKAVLRAVARDRLNSEALQRLEVILSEFKKVAGLRNNVIHGAWEISDDHPDALVWQDSAEYLDSHGEFWAGYYSHADERERMAWLQAYDGFPQRFLYFERDFQDILDRMTELARMLQGFTLALHEQTGDESSMRKR